MKRLAFKGLSDFPQFHSSPAFPSREGKAECLSEDELLRISVLAKLPTRELDKLVKSGDPKATQLGLNAMFEKFDPQ